MRQPQQLQPEGILNGVTPWSPNQQGMNPNLQGMNPNQPPPNQPPPNQQGGDPRVEAARSMAGKDADLDPESKHKIEMRRIKTLLDAADRELQMAVQVPPPGKNPQIAPRTEEEVRGRLQGGGAELLSQLMPGLEQQMRPKTGIGGLPTGGPPTGGLGQLLAGLGGGRGRPPTGRPPTGGPPTGGPPTGRPPTGRREEFGGLPQLSAPNLARPQMAAQGGIVGYQDGGDVENALYDEMGKQYLPGQSIPDTWRTLSTNDPTGPLNPAGGEYADELRRMERTRREYSTRTIPEFLSDLLGSQLTESKARDILRSPLPAILKDQVERGIISEQEAANEIQKIMSGPKTMGQRWRWNRENPNFLPQLEAMKESRERVLEAQEAQEAQPKRGPALLPETETFLEATEILENPESTEEQKAFAQMQLEGLEDAPMRAEMLQQVDKIRAAGANSDLAEGGAIKRYQSIGSVESATQAITGAEVPPRSTEYDEEFAELLGTIGSGTLDRATQSEEDLRAAEEAERVRAEGYLNMTEDELKARQSIIDAEKLYQPSQTEYKRAEQAYHEDIASEDEARLREREMLYDILTTPGGVTSMARRSVQVRPEFREDRRKADLDVAGSIRDVAGAVRDETVVPAKLEETLAKDKRTIRGDVYGKGQELYATLSAARNQAMQTASQLIVGIMGTEQAERFQLYNARLNGLNAQLQAAVHAAEIGQAKLSTLMQLQSSFDAITAGYRSDYNTLLANPLMNQPGNAANMVRVRESFNAGMREASAGKQTVIEMIEQLEGTSPEATTLDNINQSLQRLYPMLEGETEEDWLVRIQALPPN